MAGVDSAEIIALELADEDATRAAAQRLAAHLRPGDSVLLKGPVGAGKSAFVRAAIHALQGAAGQPPEPVPSPTYTLVQEYWAADLNVWHADLYRLSDPGELVELGLDLAFEAAVVFVEWPELLGRARPARCLELTLTPDTKDAQRRHLTAVSHGPDWSKALASLAKVVA